MTGKKDDLYYKYDHLEIDNFICGPEGTIYQSRYSFYNYHLKVRNSNYITSITPGIVNNIICIIQIYKYS